VAGDWRADRRSVLADAGGGDESVEATEGGGEAPCMQRAAMDEVVERGGCACRP